MEVDKSGVLRILSLLRKEKQIMYGDITQKIVVHEVDYRNLVEIVPIRNSIDGDALSMPIEGGWKEIEVGIGSPVPDGFKPLSLPKRWAEMLRDELVRVLGYSEKDATTQELKATKYHLEDFRKLHFSQMGITGRSGSI